MAISTRLFRITEDLRGFGIEGKVCPVGGRLFFFVMKSSSFWTCILTIKLYRKRRHIGTSAKKNHAYESLLYRVQILIIYIAIANKNMSQSCLTMGMAAAGEWLSFTISEKRADNHQLSTLCLIQIQFSKSFQVQLQAAAVFRQHRTKPA